MRCCGLCWSRESCQDSGNLEMVSVRGQGLVCNQGRGAGWNWLWRKRASWRSSPGSSAGVHWGLLGTSVPCRIQRGDWAGSRTECTIYFSNWDALSPQPPISPDVAVAQGGSLEDNRDSVSGVCAGEVCGDPDFSFSSGNAHFLPSSHFCVKQGLKSKTLSPGPVST